METRDLNTSQINNIIYPTAFFKNANTGGSYKNQIIIKKSHEADKHIFKLNDIVSPTSHLFWSALPEDIKKDSAQLISLGEINILIKDFSALTLWECHALIRFCIESKGLETKPKIISYVNSYFSELNTTLSKEQKTLLKFFDIHDYNAFDDNPII